VLHPTKKIWLEQKRLSINSRDALPFFERPKNGYVGAEELPIVVGIERVWAWNRRVSNPSFFGEGPRSFCHSMNALFSLARRSSMSLSFTSNLMFAHVGSQYCLCCILHTISELFPPLDWVISWRFVGWQLLTESRQYIASGCEGAFDTVNSPNWWSSLGKYRQPREKITKFIRLFHYGNRSIVRRVPLGKVLQWRLTRLYPCMPRCCSTSHYNKTKYTKQTCRVKTQ
jgi:hypothetical protein